MRLCTAVVAVCVLLLGGMLLDSPSLSGDHPRVALAATSGSASPTEAAVPTEGAFTPYWVAAHAETSLWPSPTESAESIGDVIQWAAFYVVQPAQEGRLYVWNPAALEYAWVDAWAVGPIDFDLLGTEYLPPIGMRVAWTGPARVTMYTCVELGGCAPTASGLWPEVGMVAVDPRVIPLGSTIWIHGLGTFIAADTGSAVRGSHIDVFSTSYVEALQWGVQSMSIMVFEPS